MDGYMHRMWRTHRTKIKLNKMKVEEAKKILKDSGYYVDNLWHVDDVHNKFKDADKWDAQDILNTALNNQYIIEDINDAIERAGDVEGFTQLEDVSSLDHMFGGNPAEEINTISDGLQNKKQWK